MKAGYDWIVRAAVLSLWTMLGSVATAQSTAMISDLHDGDSPRSLSVTPGQPTRQSITATFLVQGDGLPLSDLTVSHRTALNGSRDQMWLQNSDAGFQAKLLLNTTFSAEIDGAPAQADAAGALQSLIGAAAAQGYTVIPSGSSLKFVHTLTLSTWPVMQKSPLQILDSYTLQDAALGVGSSAEGVGVLQGAVTRGATKVPAKATAPSPKSGTSTVTPTK